MNPPCEPKGLSAAGARKIIKRAKTPSSISAPSQYEIFNGDGQSLCSGTFKAVAELCPKVNASTLKRRLDGGERNLTNLRRPPQDKARRPKRFTQ